LLHAIGNRLFNHYGLPAYTRFTRWVPTIFLLRVFGEVCGCGRQPLLTSVALLALWCLLGYDVHTLSLLTCLASRQGMLQHRSGKTLLPHDYTTNPLCKPVYTLSYPLAIWTCRKETRCPR
jgi:hypothetical protein